MSDFQSFMFENMQVIGLSPIETSSDKYSSESENISSAYKFQHSKISNNQSYNIDKLNISDRHSALKGSYEYCKQKDSKKVQSVELLKQSKLRRNLSSNSRCSRASDRIVSSPEILSKADFIMIKTGRKTHNKIHENTNKLTWSKPIIDKPSFKMNKNCLIQSLNQLSNSNCINLNDSNETLNDTLSEDLSLSFPEDVISKSSSLNSLLIEPYLSKFEQESLNNTKNNMIKDFNSCTKNVFAQNFVNKVVTDPIKTSTNDDEDIYRLYKSTKFLIPWEHINPKSANFLLEFIASNEDIYQPDFNIYDINGEIINEKKVNKWISIIRDNILKKIKRDQNRLVLPINEISNKKQNRVRLHSNEEIFDEVSEDSYEADSYESESSSRSSNSDLAEELSNKNRFYFQREKKPLNLNLSNLKESAILKQKSPEKQMLYYDWFEIVKKMQKDPNFDLEALIRTRGRFTEHEKITYRDVLKQKLKQKENSSKLHSLNYAKSDSNVSTNLNKPKKNTNDICCQSSTSFANHRSLNDRKSADMKLTLKESDIKYIRDTLSRKNKYFQNDKPNKNSNGININSQKNCLSSNQPNKTAENLRSKSVNFKKGTFSDEIYQDTRISSKFTNKNQENNCLRKIFQIKPNDKKLDNQSFKHKNLTLFKSNNSSFTDSSVDDLSYANTNQIYRNGLANIEQLNRYQTDNRMHLNKKQAKPTPPARPPPPKVSIFTRSGIQINEQRARFVKRTTDQFCSKESKCRSSPLPSRPPLPPYKQKRSRN